MAKLEVEKKKVQGKKRKKAVTNDDEVVASKSIVLEQPEIKSKGTELVKTVKRKIESTESIKEKRKKPAKEEASGEEDELHEPTLDELRESEKPENSNAVVTVRQKKKRKHEQRQQEQLHQNYGKKRQCDEEYLFQWKHKNDEWKFVKRRQISVQQSVFDNEKIDENHWPIALEYLSGSKGASKDVITKLAEQVIDEMDKQCADNISEEKNVSILNSTKYQRARALLQSFA